MSKPKSKPAMVAITLLIAFIELAVLQILIYLGAAPGGEVDTALSILITAVTYIILSALLTLFKKYRLCMWIAIHAFVYVCIFLFYSKRLVDILAFLIVLFGLLFSMTILDDKIKKTEGDNSDV